jgi:hypothetical protein
MTLTNDLEIPVEQADLSGMIPDEVEADRSGFVLSTLGVQSIEMRRCDTVQARILRRKTRRFSGRRAKVPVSNPVLFQRPMGFGRRCGRASVLLTWA